MKIYSSDIQSKLFVSLELQNRVETIVLDCIVKAQNVYGADKVNQIPEICYNKRSSRVAGTACWDPGTGHMWIDLNPVLLNENVEAFLDRTVYHEVAHIVTYQVWGHNAGAHGHPWQTVMSLFGKDASRCHSYDTTTVKQLRVKNVYPVKCERCGREFPVSATIMGKMKKGQVRTHNSCGGKIKLMSYHPYTPKRVDI